MANVDAPFGLRPLESDVAGGYAGKLKKYAVATNYGTALYRGDPVLITGTSVADPVTGKVIPYVGRAGTTGYITGVIVAVVGAGGLDADDALNESTPQYIAANTGGFVLVNDDPNTLYEIQTDGTLAVTDVGNTADLIFTHAGSTATGQAGAELDTADIGTGDMLVIEGVSDRSRNDLSSANPVAIVRINKHQHRNTTGV
jgi:hypothetical protein